MEVDSQKHNTCAPVLNIDECGAGKTSPQRDEQLIDSRLSVEHPKTLIARREIRPVPAELMTAQKDYRRLPVTTERTKELGGVRVEMFWRHRGGWNRKGGKGRKSSTESSSAGALSWDWTIRKVEHCVTEDSTMLHHEQMGGFDIRREGGDKISGGVEKVCGKYVVARGAKTPTNSLTLREMVSGKKSR